MLKTFIHDFVLIALSAVVAVFATITIQNQAASRPDKIPLNERKIADASLHEDEPPPKKPEHAAAQSAYDLGRMSVVSDFEHEMRQVRAFLKDFEGKIDDWTKTSLVKDKNHHDLMESRLQAVEARVKLLETIAYK